MSARLDFEAALALLKSGDLAATRVAALSLWTAAPEARIATLLALIADRGGRREEAAHWLEQAAELDPRNAGIRHQLGTTLANTGRIDDALAAWRTALALAPDRGATWLALGQALLAKRDADGYLPGLAALRKAAAFEATHDAATAAFVDGIRPTGADGASAGGTAATTPATGSSLAAPAGHVAISVVMCTIDPPRAARAQASYRAALGGTPHEFVVIDRPPSLAAGYADGLRRATGDIVVFSHDDVEILADGFGARLCAHLARCDIVGVAGATEVRGPAWAQAGHPYLHGTLGYPIGEGFEAHVYSTQGPHVAGARVLDGVLLAMRRDIAEGIGWDAVAFDAFHGYDVDFCLRASAQGRRLAIACDLGVLHHSQGTFDERWESYARTLMRRHPVLNQPVSDRTFAFAAKCGSRAALAAYFRGLRAALDALASLSAPLNPERSSPD